MELYPIDLAIHIVNIIVLFVILRMLLFKPVRKFMAARDERIQAQMNAAADTKSQAEQLRGDYEEKLAAAQATVDQLVADGRKQAAEMVQHTLDEAKHEAAALMSKAQQDAEEQKLRTMDSAKGELADLAVDMAGRILRFDDLVKQRVAGEAKEKQGTLTGTLKTAQACTEQELAEIIARLEALLGSHLQLSVSVDESLLGGFAAFIGGKVYDFSYSAQLGQLKRKLS